MVWACRMQGPVLDRLSEELSEDKLKIDKIDVDENPLTARSWNYVYSNTPYLKMARTSGWCPHCEQIKAIAVELS